MLLGVDGIWEKERGENETRKDGQSTEHKLISLVKEAGTGSTILLQGLKCKSVRTRGHTYFSVEAFCFDCDCNFSRSHRSCFTTFSATSPLAPLYFAPLLSCVVDQRTSPSLETKRTAIRASLIVSVDACESAIPAPRAMNPPLLEPETDPP